MPVQGPGESLSTAAADQLARQDRQWRNLWQADTVADVLEWGSQPIDSVDDISHGVAADKDGDAIQDRAANAADPQHEFRTLGQTFR